MDLIYKKADKNDIDALINLKIKQSIYNNSDIALKNEEEERKTIKNVLLQELNKTIHFFIAIDKNTNQTIASNGVIIHQMVPSELDHCKHGDRCGIRGDGACNQGRGRSGAGISGNPGWPGRKCGPGSQGAHDAPAGF